MEDEIQSHIFHRGAFTYYLVRNRFRMNVEELIGFDGIVVEGGDPEFSRLAIRSIRQHFNPEVYLKPVFLLSTVEHNDPVLNVLVDAHLINLKQLDYFEDTMRELYLRISNIHSSTPISFEARIINKTINFLYTRKRKTLKPLTSIHSAIGYTYPELSVNFSSNDEHRIFKVLKIAERENLFTSRFHQRVYVCTNCQNGFLNYREVCPNCQSSDSEFEELVHHFACAYVGPSSDFKNTIDDQLNCPKCNKALRHIGVDYDKPSNLYTCKQCSHQYQDFNVKALCIYCGQDNDVDKLVPKEIKTYEITKKGENSAISGYLSTSEDLEEIKGTITPDVFNLMVRYEVERLRQNDQQSNLAYVHVSNAGELYSRIGVDRQKALIDDLIQILRQNLRSSDFITFHNASCLLLSMNDLPARIAQNVLNDIKVLTTRLLKQTLKNVEVKIDTRVVPLNIEQEYQEQIQHLIDLVDAN